MENAEQYIPKRSTRKKIVTATLLFDAATVAYIVALGNPDNSLHTSALSWAYTSGMAVIGAYVFGAVWDNMTSMRK